MRFQHKILPQLEKKKCDNNEVLRLESHNHKESLFPRFFFQLCVSFVSYFLMTLEHAIWHFDWCFKVKKGEGGINPHVAHLQIWLVCFIFDPIKSYKFLENTSLKKIQFFEGVKNKR